MARSFKTRTAPSPSGAIRRHSRSDSRVSAIAVVAALGLWSPTALAQTTITPDIGAPRGLGTTLTRSGNVFAVDGGTLSGANLFHSFSQFDLGRGDTASWVRAAGDAGAVRNVINRVTGGHTSRIAGTIDSSALPNASFIFLNPAGVVFSDGARVNVPAAAYFSTAADLRFADRTRFLVNAGSGSTLSVAPPQSFGFVGNAAISVDGLSESFTHATASLSLLAGDISITRSELVLGNLDLVAAGRGAVTIGASRIALSPSAEGGALNIVGRDVAIDGSRLTSDTSGAERGGDLVISAANLSLGRDTQLGVSSRGPGASGDISISADRIDGGGALLFASGSGDGRGGRLSLSADVISLEDVTLSSIATGRGPGGDIEILAGGLAGEHVRVVAQSTGPGRGGAITLDARYLELSSSTVGSVAGAAGAPGDVSIYGDEILLSGGVFGSLPGVDGNTGNLIVEANAYLEIDGSALAVTTSTGSQAKAVSLKASELVISHASILSDAASEGSVGSLFVQGDHLLIGNSHLQVDAHSASGGRGTVQLVASGDIGLADTLITSSARDLAGGGVILVKGRDVRLDRSIIRSDTLGDGDAGRVSIDADRLLMQFGAISSNTYGSGRGGEVLLAARGVVLANSAAVTSDTFAAGHAGDVTVAAGVVVIADNASITSETSIGTGDAGAISIVSDSLTITNGFVSSDTEGPGDAGAVSIRTGTLLIANPDGAGAYISSDTLGDGDAGDVTIDAASITLRERAFISSTSFETGDAGRVTIRTGGLEMRSGSAISSDALGSGNAGDVSIAARDVLLDGDGHGVTFVSSDSLGAGRAGTVTISATSLGLKNGAFISSDAYGAGRAGDVQVAAAAVSLDNNATIRSDTFGLGRAGNVTVDAGAITVADGAGVTSEAHLGSLGDAGAIRITSDTLMITGGALVSTTSNGEGDAGEVVAAAKTILLDGGAISSAADLDGRGASGSLQLKADLLTVRNGGAVSTVSGNPKPAGQIDITTRLLVVEGAGSIISSENQSGNTEIGAMAGPGGDAGGVVITAQSLTVSEGGSITTNAFGGAAGDIFITLDQMGLLVLEGAVDPGVIQTSSGRATGGRITIADPLAIISNGGSILALGQQRGANVTIRSRYFINSTDRANVVAVDGDVRLETGLYDVSSDITVRDVSVVDASKVLRGQCPAARATGSTSQLVARPIGPYAQEPPPAYVRVGRTC